MRSDSDPARDSGLQPERTRLAWRRTALTATVVALLLGRLALATGGASASGAVGLAATAFVWLGVLAVAQGRIRAMRYPRPHPAPLVLPLTVGGSVAAFAVVATALLLWD